MPVKAQPPLDAGTERAARMFMGRISGRYFVDRAILFGSRARRTHAADSDADIAVVLKGEHGKRSTHQCGNKPRHVERAHFAPDFCARRHQDYRARRQISPCCKIKTHRNARNGMLDENCIVTGLRNNDKAAIMCCRDSRQRQMRKRGKINRHLFCTHVAPFRETHKIITGRRIAGSKIMPKLGRISGNFEKAKDYNEGGNP